MKKTGEGINVGLSSGSCDQYISTIDDCKAAIKKTIYTGKPWGGTGHFTTRPRGSRNSMCYYCIYCYLLCVYTTICSYFYICIGLYTNWWCKTLQVVVN